MHPYHNLPPAAYWRSAVAEVNPLEMTSLYRPRFELTRNMKIATAGSCFAQHIGRTFKTRGYNVLDVESAPAFLQEEDHVRFGFGMYSARFGNIYTIRHLVQLFNPMSSYGKPTGDTMIHFAHLSSPLVSQHQKKRSRILPTI